MTETETQDVKLKGPYKMWSDHEHKMLLRLLVDAVNQGFRHKGKFNQLTVETRILPTLKAELGSTKTYNQYKNRMKILRSKYQSLADLLRFSSGFGWDPETKRFTASDEVWSTYLKVENYIIHFMHMLVFKTYDSHYDDIIFSFLNRLIQVIHICVMNRSKTLRS